MKAKKIITFSLAALFLIASLSLGLAQDKKKKKKTSGKKIQGQIILHQNKKDIKVLKEDWSTMTIYYDKKTKFEAVAEAKDSDLAKESGPPKGTVTYIMKDGKPVAQTIQYKARENWGIKAKKKKK